eukprot:5162079-Pyramimonas_sp.AAC.1
MFRGPGGGVVEVRFALRRRPDQHERAVRRERDRIDVSVVVPVGVILLLLRRGGRGVPRRVRKRGVVDVSELTADGVVVQHLRNSGVFVPVQEKKGPG